MPYLSVVIPAYNEEKYINIPLLSLSKQNLRDFEIIVCLNNCSDGTRAVVEKFIRQTGTLCRIVEEKQKGVVWARQTGFSQARGEIIASADADTYYPPDWLERIAQNFSRRPIVGLYGPVYVKSAKWYWRVSAHYFFTSFLRLSHWLGNDNLNGMNFAVRAGAFKKVNGFNTAWRSAEDIYLGQKLKTVGVVKFDRRLVVYTNDRRFVNNGIRSLQHHARNYYRVFFLKKAPLDFQDIR